MTHELKLGSLFDGSGGFPLAGILHGIRPVWASEIEEFPIRVTKNRFPNMKHLGSVTDVNGAEVEPVDIITFGSPCQDLSVAGKQLGIHDGERSNLFFEAIRIIKEMRDATANEYPRFAVWENVPGAFSSNGGDDFKAVIEAFCHICEPGISIPGPADGVWQPAGCVLGDGYSLAWRVYDAQYWGVPQRRKRIYLVADFRTERAGEILFESDSVSGDPQPGEEAWKRIARDAQGGVGGSTIAFKERAGKPGGARDYCPVMTEPSPSQPATARRSPTGCGLTNDNAELKKISEGGWNRSNKEQTDNSNDDICSITSRQQSMATEVGTAGTPAATDYKEPQSVCYPINTMVATRGGADDGRTTFGIGEQNDPQFTLSAAHEHGVCYAIDSQSSNSMKSANPSSGFHEESVAKTLDTNPDPTCNQGGNVIVEPFDLPKCVQANGWQYGDVVSTLCGDHGNRVTDFTSICIEETKNINATAFTNRASPTDEVAETLRAESHGAIPMVAAFMGGQGAKARSIAYCEDGTTPTIKASPSGGNTVPDTVYCLEGNGARPSHFGNGYSDEKASYTMNTTEQHAVAYAMEGNTVDRNSGKNGKGYCEDVSPTLNTQDKHAVAYGIDQQGGKGNAGYGENVSPTLCAISHGTPNAVAFEPGAAKRLDPNSRIGTVAPTLRAEMGDNQPAVAFQSCGDRTDPSVSVSDKAYCIPANPMSDRQQAVCFQQNQREEVRDMGEQAGALTAEAGSHNQNYVCYPDKARSLLARADGSWCPDRGQDIVCYAPEGNHCGAYREDDVSATLQTGYHYGSDGDAAAIVSCIQNTGRGWYNDGDVAETLRTPAGGDSLKSNLVVEQRETTVYPIENHAMDSRCELSEPDEPCQTLTNRMGTGGGNVPMILMKEKDDE